MEYKKMLITPSIAKQMLEANTENRILKPKIVAKYAKEMSEGKWMYPTGEVIKICTDGTMLDAQHRLHAVIKSNTNQYFDVAYGLDRKVFSVLDTGLKRNSPDCFYIEKIAYSSILPLVGGLYSHFYKISPKDAELFFTQ